MRCRAVLTVIVVTASLSAVRAPASAVPPIDDSRPADRAGEPNCSTGLVIATDDGRVRYDLVEKDKVTSSRPSKRKLGFTVSAWGFYDDIDGKKTDVFQLNAITSKGERKVSLSFTGKKKIGLSSTRYAKARGFKPVLFADGYTYYAYIVTSSGQLQRWTLTRFRDGKVRFADKVALADGMSELTSLQTTAVFKLKGSAKEVLYGTTVGGALVQLTIPIKRPQRMKTRTLLSSGLEGVTELSWSTCGNSLDHTSLIAVDPEAGTARWVTIKHSNTRPKVTVRGEVRGGDFRGVTALF
jgi:hypothetical protein